MNRKTVYIVVENQGGVCVGINAFASLKDAEDYQDTLDTSGGDDDSYVFSLDLDTMNTRWI